MEKLRKRRKEPGIDLTINKTPAKIYSSANCGSGYFPIICRPKLKLRKLKKSKATPKLQQNRLHDYSICRYILIVKSKYKSLEFRNSKRNNLSEALVKSVNDFISRKGRKKKWMT